MEKILKVRPPHFKVVYILNWGLFYFGLFTRCAPFLSELDEGYLSAAAGKQDK